MYRQPITAGAGGWIGTDELEPVVPSQPLKVDSVQGVCDLPEMNGTALLFPELERRSSELKQVGLLERWRSFGKLAEQFGGLAPQAFVHELLDVSRQRVHELVKNGHLEQVDFMGTKWISGRSLSEWINNPRKLGGGRANKRPSKWREWVFGAKTSLAEFGAIIPDHWVED